MSKILVTGASGTIGHEVIKALTERKASFIEAVRNRDKLARSGISEEQIVHFDFADPSTFEAATEGVDAVFLLGPPLVTNLHEMLSPFISHLKNKGISRVVYVGALGLEKLEDLPFHEIVINQLKKEGFDLTVVKPSFFAQNFKKYEWDNITRHSITYVVAGNGKVGFVDAEDVGRSVAAILTEEGHGGKEYELTGPELLSYYDAANLLSEVAGRQIVYPNPEAEEYTATLKAAGAPDYIAPYMISVYSLIKNNLVAYLTDDVEKLTGKKPTPLKEVLQRDLSSLK